MPLNYSPIRYALFLIPVALVFCFSLTDYVLTLKLSGPHRTAYARFFLLFLVIWQVLFQVVSLLFYDDNTESRIQVWYTLPLAAIILLLVRHRFNKYGFRLNRTSLITGVAVCLVISALVNVQHFANRVLPARGSSIQEASDDLSDILGGTAVVSGPYGPVLTLNTKLRSFIHLFGVASVDSTLFERHPITHLAIDSSNWLEAVKNYPQLADMQSLTVYWIRDTGVKITNVSKRVGNAKAVQYRETAYERATQYFSKGIVDSAYAAIREFLSEKPNNRSANLLLADIYMANGRFKEGAVVLRNVAARYPDDYYTNLICGRSLQIIGILQRDNYTIALAQKYYDKAAENNPFKAAHVRTVYVQTRQQFSTPAPGDTP